MDYQKRAFKFVADLLFYLSQVRVSIRFMPFWLCCMVAAVLHRMIVYPFGTLAGLLLLLIWSIQCYTYVEDFIDRVKVDIRFVIRAWKGNYSLVSRWYNRAGKYVIHYYIEKMRSEGRNCAELTKLVRMPHCREWLAIERALQKDGYRTVLRGIEFHVFWSTPLNNNQEIA